MKNKPFKVYIEVPEGWFDSECPIGWNSIQVRNMAQEKIQEAITMQLMSKVKVPEITIPEEEIREAVKERMVDDIIRKSKEG